MIEVKLLTILPAIIFLLLVSCSTFPIDRSTILSRLDLSAGDLCKVLAAMGRLYKSDIDQGVTTLWHTDFSELNWLDHWHSQLIGTWGMDNFEVINTLEDPFTHVLRVHYPQNSASPAVARRYNVPVGGGEFRGDLNLEPREGLRLSYYLRFSDEFEFVKGGKLPGLFGGTAISGGNIPDGTNGFSTRFMWRKNGNGEIYAYLPGSQNWGTSIGQGDWRFVPGKWHNLVQDVILNQPGRNDGIIRVWLDGELVVERDDLVFRSVDTLKIDGIFFSSFFGGGDLSWATPKNVHIDFAEFSVAEPTSP